MWSSGFDPRYDRGQAEAEVARRRERTQQGGLRSLPSFVLVIVLLLMAPYWAGRALWRIYRKLRRRTSKLNPPTAPG